MCIRDRLLFVRYVVFQAEGGRVWPRRILEAEERIVFDFVEQGERCLEVLLGLAREADDDVGGDGINAPRVLEPADALDVFVARVEMCIRDRAKARSGSAYLPPSENESGVTLSTAISSVRSPS